MIRLEDFSPRSIDNAMLVVSYPAKRTVTSTSRRLVPFKPLWPLEAEVLLAWRRWESRSSFHSSLPAPDGESSSRLLLSPTLTPYEVPYQPPRPPVLEIARVGDPVHAVEQVGRRPGPRGRRRRCLRVHVRHGGGHGGRPEDPHRARAGGEQNNTDHSRSPASDVVSPNRRSRASSAVVAPTLSAAAGRAQLSSTTSSARRDIASDALIRAESSASSCPPPDTPTPPPPRTSVQR